VTSSRNVTDVFRPNRRPRLNRYGPLGEMNDTVNNVPRYRKNIMALTCWEVSYVVAHDEKLKRV